LNNTDDIALYLLKPGNSYYSMMKACIRFLDEDGRRRTCLRNVMLEEEKVVMV